MNDMASIRKIRPWPAAPWGSLGFAGAAVAVTQLVRDAVRRGTAGLEFAEGIPGTVGGALIMNAGAYGSEFERVVDAVDAIGIAFETAGDLWFQRRASRHRIESQHLQELAAQHRPLLLPILERLDIGQAARGHLRSEAFQLIGRHRLALGGAFLCEQVPGARDNKQHKESEDFGMHQCSYVRLMPIFERKI